MFSLLKIISSNYKGLEQNFTLDFVTQERVTSDSRDSEETIQLEKGLYVQKILAVTGGNASGKSTTLSLIFQICYLLNNGTWIGTPSDFKDKNSPIKFHIEFYLNSFIYLYDIEIVLNTNKYIGLDTVAPIFLVKKESLLKTKYSPNYGRKYVEKGNFEEVNIEENDKKTINDFGISIVKNITNNFVIANYFGPNISYVENVSRVTNLFNLLKECDKELLSHILKILDNSIEKFELIGNQLVKFKRVGSKASIISFIEALNLVSSGTIKGLEIYIKLIKTIQSGGMIIIDEIENSFTKILLANILMLIADNDINTKNAQLVFSTHYIEMLNLIDRRDLIIYVERKDAGITATNYYKYKFRSELSKSACFENEFFSKMVNYNDLINIKRLIKSEVSNNDWRRSGKSNFWCIAW